MTPEAFRPDDGFVALRIGIVGRPSRTAGIEDPAIGIDPEIEFRRGELKSLIDTDCQAFAAVFIEDVQRPEYLAVVGPAVDEVVAPDMASMLGPKPGA